MVTESWYLIRLGFSVYYQNGLNHIKQIYRWNLFNEIITLIFVLVVIFLQVESNRACINKYINGPVLYHARLT